MGSFPSWIQLWCNSLIIPSLHWCTESQYIQICTCIGTVITTCQQISVSLTPLDTEPRQSVPTNIYSKRKKSTSTKILGRCRYPAWALNRVTIKLKNNKTTNQRYSKNKNTGSNNRPYNIVPYVKGMSESCKKTAVENMWLKYISKEEILSRTSWYTPKIKKPSYRRVEWSTDTSVVGWTVRKSILGNQAEHLQEDLENTWGPPHPSMTITTSLFMNCLWKIVA